MDPGPTISVELVRDEGGGSRFLNDICSMLERIAERVGLPLQVVRKTYNYPARRVMIHETAEVAPLDVVLGSSDVRQ